MSEHRVLFDTSGNATSADFQTLSLPFATVKTGTLLSEAIRLAGLDILQPCGGQGRCGRCIVQVVDGVIRRRSSLRLSPEDVEKGYALACQTVVEGDVLVSIPPQEKIERRLTTDRTAIEVQPPDTYNFRFSQTIRRYYLQLSPPQLDDQTDDWSRLQTVLRQRTGIERIDISLNLLRQMGTILREGDWTITAIMDVLKEQAGNPVDARIIDLQPGKGYGDEPLWGAAIDIGTTTVTVWLVDLITGQVRAQASEYNGQIARGEDVISRIIYASRDQGGEEMRTRVLDTINSLLNTVCKRVRATPDSIMKLTVAGNSTMAHLFLGIPAASIRLSPFITAANDVPLLRAQDVGIQSHPEAVVDCLPGVASYVGSDITAGVLSTGMDESQLITLFIDVGTNGEIVLGSRDWLITCACSAGPAFEGAGVIHGMRATTGAIEEVWIAGPGSEHPYEPTYRVIGRGKPKGICGSGLISLLAEAFMTGLIDKAGGI
ncbi:MAG: ASKHA domain-containing protein, partial [Omnitrophica WOR_2 bacterium]